jgi:TonB-dependent SusC/RagA subfamily outer membrane receptor
MRTPGPRSAGWIFVIASTATGCIPQPMPLGLSSTPVDLNAPPATHAEASPAGFGAAARRGDIPLGETAHYSRIEELLIARVPALDVRSAGKGRFTLRVRGASSLLSSGAPLIVVDGMQFTDGGTESLAGYAPYQIRSVEVLRDVSETGIYGPRGSSGVVVITTRRARR